MAPYNGGSTSINVLGNSKPTGPGGSGDVDDAKVYELLVQLAANEVKVVDVDANAFYVDSGPTSTGVVEFNVDECTPLMAFRYGLFFRTRRFRRMRFHNLTGVAQVLHLILSRNPDFLVMQFTV